MFLVAQKWDANKAHCSSLPYLVIIEQLFKPTITIVLYNRYQLYSFGEVLI